MSVSDHDLDLSCEIFKAARRGNIDIPVSLWREYESLIIKCELDLAEELSDRGYSTSDDEYYLWMYLSPAIQAVTRDRMCAKQRIIAHSYKWYFESRHSADLIAARISIDPYLQSLMESAIMEMGTCQKKMIRE